MMPRPLLLITALTVTACASPVKLQNVAGTWSCPRVDGVCATTDALDRQVTGTAQATLVTVQPTEFTSSAGPVSETMGRTYDQVARIVFAPLVDDQGRYHEARVIHAVMQRGSWLPGQAMVAGIGEGVE